MICEKCGKEFEEDWRKDPKSRKEPCRFCSRSCSNSRERTEEVKCKISISSRNSIKAQIQRERLRKKSIESRVLKVCLSCGEEFSVPPSGIHRIYCSRNCFGKHHIPPKASGGYRKGSGRGKSGYFKGIYCASTYELVWVIYQMDKKIPFDCFDEKLEFEGEIYYPDFFQDNRIVEIKGYHSPNVEKQVRVAKGLGYDIVVLYKEDLEKEFEYVRTTYGVTSNEKFHQLYDGYKPKYKKVCIVCGKDYEHDNKHSKCCSPECGSRASAYYKNKKS